MNRIEKIFLILGGLIITFILFLWLSLLMEGKEDKFNPGQIYPFFKEVKDPVHNLSLKVVQKSKSLYQLSWVGAANQVQTVVAIHNQPIASGVYEMYTKRLYYTVNYEGIEGCEIWLYDTLSKKRSILFVYKNLEISLLKILKEGNVEVAYRKIVRTGDWFVGNTVSSSNMGILDIKSGRIYLKK